MLDTVLEGPHDGRRRRKEEPVNDLAPPPPLARDVSSAGTGVRFGRRGRRTSSVTPYLFLVVPIVLLVVFTYLPIANMVSYSFTKWDGLSVEREFIGLENYVDVFTRPDLFGAMLTSVYYFIGAFFQMAIALYLATQLSFKIRFRNLFKGLVFFPYLINGVAISFMFLYVFRPDGVLDGLLALVGVQDPPLFLGDRDYANYSLASTSVWRYMGLNFVLFLGAIQSIPHETFESAEMDGANRWQLFRHLIVPGIRPVIGLSFILAIAGSLSVFEIPYVMLRGANGTATFVIQTVQTAFVHHKFGLASAMAVVLLLVILLVTYVQRRVIRNEDAELV
jgi:multiple sugar transport system permease protein